MITYDYFGHTKLVTKVLVAKRRRALRIISLSGGSLKLKNFPNLAQSMNFPIVSAMVNLVL